MLTCILHKKNHRIYLLVGLIEAYFLSVDKSLSGNKIFRNHNMVVGHKTADKKVFTIQFIGEHMATHWVDAISLTSFAWYYPHRSSHISSSSSGGNSENWMGDVVGRHLVRKLCCENGFGMLIRWFGFIVNIYWGTLTYLFLVKWIAHKIVLWFWWYPFRFFFVLFCSVEMFLFFIYI